MYKAVIFDIGGVLIPQPQVGIEKYAKALNLPPTFLGSVFMNGAPNNAFCRLERGEILYREFIPLFEKEVHDAGKKAGLNVKAFNVNRLFLYMTFGRKKVRQNMLYAIKVLASYGIKTCALTNNWIDDRAAAKSHSTKFWISLRWYFDLVVESAACGIRKPDPDIYKLTCKKLEVEPHQAIFLDDIGKNLKGASSLGIKTIKVVTPEQAIVELQDLVGLDLTMNKSIKEVYPPPCKPDNVPHSYTVLKSGIKFHYVDVGVGPVVMLFHGFPEFWYSWRHQIPALVSAGYRIIAMDQRGYGDSSVPYDIDEYTQEKITQDAVDLMDSLGIPQATVIGHDWGGAVVWNLALKFPHRLSGVCGVNTPMLTGEGKNNAKRDSKVFDYQFYFQTPGVAERELEEDLERTFKLFFRGADDDVLVTEKLSLRNVTDRGGVLIGFPKDIPRGKLLTEEDLAYYVQSFKRSGTRGGLNWYRNHGVNMEWQNRFSERKITMPALMVTASHDQVLKPEFSHGMEEQIPNLTRLDIKNCAHWTQIEKADELNQGLIQWLDKIHNTNSKL